MKYAYLRVSSTDQNLARQVNAIHEYAPDVIRACVFADKQSGKDFNRPEYQRLKAVLQSGDELVIKELDRLGRNKDGVKTELQWFKDKGVTVRILDIPTTLIDFQGQTWLQEMVNNILIEVMGSISEQERKKIAQRRDEGIAAMPIVNGKRTSSKTGNPTGRPPRELPDFKKIAKKQKDGLITVTEACKELNISRTQWYRMIKESA